MIERTANVAWSLQHSQPIYLAAGTAAQQLDASFSTSAALEIFSLNLSDPGNDLGLVTSVPSDQRFHKLAWGSHGSNAGTLIGGCENGVIQIYNTGKLLNKEEGYVTKLQKHTGNVRALDFNAYQGNLFASGAAESEIFIWDLNNTSTLMSPGTKIQPPEDLVALEWNKQVKTGVFYEIVRYPIYTVSDQPPPPLIVGHILLKNILYILNESSASLSYALMPHGRSLN